MSYSIGDSRVCVVSFKDGATTAEIHTDHHEMVEYEIEGIVRGGTAREHVEWLRRLQSEIIPRAIETTKSEWDVEEDA